MITKYITFDSNGNPTGVGTSLDGTLIPNAIACTDAQAENWQSYTNVEGVLTENTSVILSLAKASQIAIVKASCDAAFESIPVTLDGNLINLANSTQDQTNNLMAIQTAQMAIATAPVWTKNTPVTAGSICSVGGVILYCSKGGTTGTTTPTVPTTFGTPVTDGTVAWELMGQLVGIYPTGAQWFTPQQVVQLGAQGTAYVSLTRAKYQALKNAINVATTIEAVQSITW